MNEESQATEDVHSKLDVFIKCLITLGAITILVIRKNIPGFEIDTLDLALLVAAAFPWLPSIIRSGKFPGGFEFEFIKVKKQQKRQRIQISKILQREQQLQREQIEQEQQRNREAIKLLRFLIVNTALSKYGIDHLRNLASPEPTPYHANSGLERDLRRLLDSGLIARRPGKGVRSIMRHEGDIKDHFEITELGQRMLSTWQAIQEEEQEELSDLT